MNTADEICAAPTETTHKGLKEGALGYVSNVVIGVASTAPAYSIAATLGCIIAVPGVGLSAPSVLLVSFLPMLCIAYAYKAMNRADPDCGTSFAWVTRGLGPHMGWLAGWTMVAADIVVMASLAHVAGRYTFLLLGWNSAADTSWAVTAAGVAWIVCMTWICVIGVELNAETQRWLLAAEVLILGVFVVFALLKASSGNVTGWEVLDPRWINPFSISSPTALIDGVLLGVFLYWGWDCAVSVNEESRDAARGPGRAAVASTVLLVAMYVVVSAAAQAYGGEQQLVEHQDDVLAVLGTQVFGSPLDKLLVLAVLTSAAASTQTTILPTARSALSMARWGALPEAFGRVSARYRTPTVSTVATGVVSVVWCVLLGQLSDHVLADSVTAVGFMIAWYYGFTGLACAAYHRRELLRSARNFILLGVVPMFGFASLAFVFFRAVIDYGARGYPEGYNQTPPLLGVEVPIIIGIGGILLGCVFMAVARFTHGEFFRRRIECAPSGWEEESSHVRPCGE